MTTEDEDDVIAEIMDYRACMIADVLLLPKRCFSRRCRQWGECKIQRAPCLRFHKHLAWRRLDALIGPHPDAEQTEDEDGC